MFRGLRGDRHLLGDGHHPAPQRRRHDPGDRQRRASCTATSASPAPGCARCAATPTCRATARWASGSASPPHFLDALADEFGFEPAARARVRHGRDDPGAARRRRPRSSSRMGGNFVAAAPDTVVTEEAMRGADAHRPGLHQAQPLPRGHGREALILPGARPQREGPAPAAASQRVTVEDSMSAVHASQGPLEPASAPALRGRHRLLARRGDARRDAPGSRGPSSAPTTPRIRHAIASVVPGCAAYDEKVDQPGGFVLPHPPRDTPHLPDRDRQGDLHGQPDRGARGARGPAAAADAALATTSSTPRSTGSTTATAASRAAVGWCSCTPTTSPPSGFADGRPRRPGQRVGTTGPSERRAPAFRVVRLRQPRGCAAAYYPETNPLVPLDSTAERQQHPDVEVGRRPPGAAPTGSGGRHRRRRRHGRRRHTDGNEHRSEPTQTLSTGNGHEQPRARPGRDLRGAPVARRSRS